MKFLLTSKIVVGFAFLVDLTLPRVIRSSLQLTCQDVANSRDNMPPGAYIPQCDSSGNYKTQQFHGSTGYSWCVDPITGEEVEGAKTAPGEDAVDCSLRDDDQKTCQEIADSTEIMPGAYVPQCDSNGNFQPQQFHGSTGYSWCVHTITGEEVEGTKTAPGENAIDCSQSDDDQNTCQEIADSTNIMPGAYVPHCDENGNFQPQQFHGSTGYSWCVDTITGEEVEGTKTAPGEDAIDCSQSDDDQKTCQEIADSTDIMPGAYVPQCDENGNFQPQQFHGSTGYTWCVEVITGVEIQGTKLAPGRGTLNC